MLGVISSREDHLPGGRGSAVNALTPSRCAAVTCRGWVDPEGKKSRLCPRYLGADSSPSPAMPHGAPGYRARLPAPVLAGHVAWTSDLTLCDLGSSAVEGTLQLRPWLSESSLRNAYKCTCLVHSKHSLPARYEHPYLYTATYTVYEQMLPTGRALPPAAEALGAPNILTPIPSSGGLASADGSHLPEVKKHPCSPSIRPVDSD